MIILNRIDMADPAMVRRGGASYFKRQGHGPSFRRTARAARGSTSLSPAVRTLLAEKLARYAEKGQVGRPLKLMVVGIPNVGKSTFINQIAGRKGAKAENRPGVTRGKQWVTVDQGLLLLDTPGILWPKFEDPQVGHAAGLHRRGEGRCPRYGDAGLPPDGAALAKRIPGRGARSATRLRSRRTLTGVGARWRRQDASAAF